MKSILIKSYLDHLNMIKRSLKQNHWDIIIRDIETGRQKQRITERQIQKDRYRKTKKERQRETERKRETEWQRDR